MDRPSHKETAIILDSIADGVLTVGRDWRITSFNRAAEQIAGTASWTPPPVEPVNDQIRPGSKGPRSRSGPPGPGAPGCPSPEVPW